MAATLEPAEPPMIRRLTLLASLLAATAAAAGVPKTTTRERRAADGYQLVPGPEFSVQVKLKETHVTGAGDQKRTLYVFDYVVTANATGKIHGGHGENRLEASVDDMVKPSRWQFKDLDGDGHGDFRYYQGDGKSDYWWAWVWEPKRKTFTFGKKYAGP
jgi:hypothetical protein